MIPRLALLLLLAVSVLPACRVNQEVPVGGEVISRTGLYDCPENSLCTDEILTDEPWSESYMAVPRDGYVFTGWGDGLCNRNGPKICRLVNVPTDFTSEDADTFLRPIFEQVLSPLQPEPQSFMGGDNYAFVPTTERVWESKILVLSGGKTLVVWATSSSIDAQLQDVFGNPLGDTFRIDPIVPAITAVYKMVLVTVGDGFAVIARVRLENNNYAVFSSVFDSSGALVGGPDTLLEFDPSSQSETDFAATESSNGGFYVAMETSDFSGVMVNEYDATGAFTREVAVFGVGNRIGFQDITELPNGNIAFPHLDYSGGEFLTACIAPNGTISPGSGNLGWVPISVAPLAGGGFAGTGLRNFGTPGQGFEVAIGEFASDCTVVSGPDRASVQSDNTQRFPVVTGIESGGYVVVWESWTEYQTDSSTPADNDGVYARLFHPGGQPMGQEFRVPSFYAGDQREPDVTSHPGNSVAFAWRTGEVPSGEVEVPLGEVSVPSYAVATRILSADRDGDALPDAWESYYGQDTSDPVSGDGDPDVDGLNNRAEYKLQSNPLLADSDLDGMDDGYEVENGLRVTEDDAAEDLDEDGASNLEEALAGTMANYGASKPGAPVPLEPGAQLLVDNISYKDWNGFPAALAQGGTVVVWPSLNDASEDQGIFGQLFNGEGRAFDEPFLVKGSRGAELRCPRAFGLQGGDFLVAWLSRNAAGTNTSIFARRFDADARPQGGAVKLVSRKTSKGNIGCSELVQLTGGDILLVWEETNADQEEYRVAAQRFDMDGIPVGEEIAVAGEPGRQAYQAAVVAKPNGSFFIVWTTILDSGQTLVEGQAFKPSALPKGEVLPISPVIGDYSSPSIARLENGSLVIVWNADGPVVEIQGGIFSSSGVAKGDSFSLSGSGQQGTSSPRVAASGSTFLVAWEYPPQVNVNSSVYGRLFGKSGAPLSDDFIINSYIDKDQSSPRVVAQVHGSYVVVWSAFSLEETLESTVTLRQYDLVEE